jgi:hypothetical protein
MSFTGNEDHSISLATASAWTKKFRNSSNEGDTIAHFYGKEAIQAILDQANCVGIRIYYAIDDNGNKQLVLVGANAAENDLYEGLLAERGTPCPTKCSATNPLNS